MSRTLTTLLRTLIALSTLIVVELSPTLGQAQNVYTIDLAEPRSSEQFFQQGRQQLEREIQRLQNPRPETPLLTISPALEQQLKHPVQPLAPEKSLVQPELPIVPTSTDR
jgi:hypothetical protein